jgi:hypothetical protein
MSATRWTSRVKRWTSWALLGAASGSVLLHPVEADAQTTPSVAVSEEPEYPRARQLHFDLPAIDVRENASLGYWPSMRQSMAVTKDTYYAVHGALLSIPYPKSWPSWVVTLLDWGVIGATDYYTFAVPPFLGWHHEEWHRAVMSQYGIGSYDDINDFPIGQELVSVSHVKDADLVRLKREHPADQVRLSAAGIEADFARQIEFDKDRFFFGTRAGTVFVEWLGALNAIGYMTLAAEPGSDKETSDFMAQEGNSVGVRDFTGLDPDGWVYDLFRPDEPYAARGVHPTGVGIDRYRSYSDLRPRERRYLKNTAALAWLNLVNPQLFGLYQFKAGKFRGQALRFNASLHSVMAPFGYMLGLNLFAKAAQYNLFTTLNGFMSERLVLPGLSAELLRLPVPGLRAYLTPRARLWLQSKDQRFDAGSAVPGAALEARLNVPLVSTLEAYVEAAAKTSGWIPGNEFLRSSLTLRTGLEAFVF